MEKEMMEERYELAFERIREMAAEENIAEKYNDYCRKNAALLSGWMKCFNR
mgnify:CR=1 FL=1